MRRPHALPSSALYLVGCLLCLVGCDEALDCDTSAVYSVTVSLYDVAGDPYAPEDVTYEVDDLPEESCEPISEGTEFLCGVEEIGTFLIRVYDDGGQVVAEEEIDVDLSPDGCHVESEFLDITL